MAHCNINPDRNLLNLALLNTANVITPGSLISIDPQDGATVTNFSGTITAVFRKSILNVSNQTIASSSDCSKTETTFLLYTSSPSNCISGTLTISSDSQTLSFRPSLSLAPATYQIKIQNILDRNSNRIDYQSTTGFIIPSASVVTTTTPPQPSQINLLDSQSNTLSSGSTFTYPGIIFSGTLASRKDLSFTISNTGTGTLNLTSANLSGDSSYSIITAPSTTIAPSGQTTITVRFQPTSIGLKVGTLTINSNAQNQPAFALTLNGTAINYTPASNLQLYARFNNDITDSVNAINGTLSGGALTFGPDRFGNANSAVLGTGSNMDWLRFPNNAATNTSGTGSFTFSTWLRMPSSTGIIFERRGTPNTQEITLHVDPTNRILLLYGRASVCWATALQSGILTVGQYYHVVAVYSSNTAQLYINGSMVDSNPNLNASCGTVSSALTSGGQIQVLYNQPQNFTSPMPVGGALDNFLFFNTNLSAGQVLTLFNQDME